MVDTIGATREFLEVISIPCDVCAEITCDGFHDSRDEDSNNG